MKDEYGQTNNGCRDGAANPPIVQNILNGVRYCGNKSSKFDFLSATRPIFDSETDRWRCPGGEVGEPQYKACNEDWFDIEGGEEYVICMKEPVDLEKECPITDVTFDRKDTLDDSELAYW